MTLLDQMKRSEQYDDEGVLPEEAADERKKKQTDKEKKRFIVHGFKNLHRILY